MVVYVDAAGCTNCCRHCGTAGRPPFGAFYSLAELRQLREMWGPLVVYHEPSAHPEYPDILGPDICAVEGVHSTNGFGLSRANDPAALLDCLRDFGWEYLSLTLHGIGETHDWFVGRPGAYQDILLATDRARAHGLGVHWNVYLDNRNLEDVPQLVRLCEQMTGGSPYLAIPGHTLTPRLWRLERLRPSLSDVCERLPAWVIEHEWTVWKGDPAGLTEGSWLAAWRTAEDLQDFMHPWEPRGWPPSANACLMFTRDHAVQLDPCRAPALHLGPLSAGRDALLARLHDLPEPPLFAEAPPEAGDYEASDLLHPTGASFRYKVTATLLRGCGEGS